MALALHQNHFYYKPMLSSSARQLQLTKERQHLTVRKKVRWCRSIPFQHFPKENVIFKNTRISIPTTLVFGKYPRVRQICPQMEMFVFLETWNWGSAKATNHCGTFKWSCLAPTQSCFPRTRNYHRHGPGRCHRSAPWSVRFDRFIEPAQLGTLRQA